MSSLESIIQNVNNVAQSSKDDVAKMLTQAIQLGRVKAKEDELNLIIQIVSAAVDTNFGNAEPVLKSIIQKEIDTAFDDGLRKGLKKSRG